MDILLQTQHGVGIQRSAGSGISRAVTLWRGKASSRRIEGFQMVQCRGNWSVLSGGNSPRPGGPPGHLPGPAEGAEVAASVLYCLFSTVAQQRIKRSESKWAGTSVCFTRI